MAETQKSIATYALDGTDLDFTIPFEYLARKFIVVTLIGVGAVPDLTLTLTDNYRFTSKTQITLTRLWGPADGYNLIELRRFTSATDRLVNFSDGSILRAYDLNTSQIQSLHIAEEARDASSLALIKDILGWNALGLRVRNVGTPVDDGDAANAGYVKSSLSMAIRSTTEPLRALPSITDRSNKILGFDAGGQPVAIIPATGSSIALELELIDPAKGANKVAWLDPVAPAFLKTVSDMKAGDPVTLFRLVPRVNWSDLLNNIYDAAPNINGADDLFQTGTKKGGVLTIPKGDVKVGSELHLRGGVTVRGEGKDVSTLIIADASTIRLTGLGNTLERLCFHKATPRANYITAGHMTDASLTAQLSEIGFCKFTAGALAEFVNYALIGNYRSQGIHIHHNRMFTYHLAFITKYLISDWVRLNNNYAKALQSANVTNSELFKIEAVNKAWITGNDLVSEGVPNALSCLTLESGSSNVHVHGNTLKSDTGYAIRIEHTDNTITAPTDCTIEGNTLIASGSALALYSGSANVTGLEVTGGSITGPVTIYGKKTNLHDVTIRAGFTDPRTGLTLRGDDIKGRNIEVVGFGVGLANAAVNGLPDTNLDIRGFKASGQANESVVLKYLAGQCFLGVESINNASASTAAVSLLAGGAVTPADTLTVTPGSIKAPNMPAIKVNFMNGVTVGDCSGIRSPTPYSIITSDTYFSFESTAIAANFTSAAHRVNTVGKYAGRIVYNKDPKKPYWATGPAPTDTWVDAMGTVTYTPV